MRAHPRSRGENGGLTLSGHSDWGSSPLTRGKLRFTPQSTGSTRLIPAHAGKTLCPRRHASDRRAHPRSRGENEGACNTVHGRAGSSPLTRGKRYRRGAERSAARAHPRSRGENIADRSATSSHPGSSPLTRGKRIYRRPRTRTRRLIPAHAGKTVGVAVEINDARAHPRSRGENSSHSRSAQASPGSSPLTRGKR